MLHYKNGILQHQPQKFDSRKQRLKILSCKYNDPNVALINIPNLTKTIEHLNKLKRFITKIIFNNITNYKSEGKNYRSKILSFYHYCYAKAVDIIMQNFYEIMRHVYKNKYFITKVLLNNINKHKSDSNKQILEMQ